MGHQEGGQQLIHLLVQVGAIHNGIMGVPKLGRIVVGIGGEIHQHGPAVRLHPDVEIHRVRLHAEGLGAQETDISHLGSLKEGNQLVVQVLGNVRLLHGRAVALPAVLVVGRNEGNPGGIGGVQHGFGAEERSGGHRHQDHQHRHNFKGRFAYACLFHEISLLIGAAV